MPPERLKMQSTCNHKWMLESITENEEYKDEDGNPFFVDVLVYECEYCGEPKVDFKQRS